MSRFLVYVIADYGALHDLAFAEVTQRLYAEMGSQDSAIKAYAVPAFDTYATGFALAQTAINSRLGKTHKFYVNTAPRKDDPGPRVRNSGEGLVYTRLFNGVEIVAVNSGFSLSFVRDCAEEVRTINVSKEGSQFRSRDVFPPAFAKIVRGDYSALGEDVRAEIPEISENVVCYTDGYGNIKISVSPETLQPLMGRSLVVEIGGHRRVAKVTDGIFGVPDGQLCFAAGSSGWTLPDGTPRRFSEIVLRGGNAAEEFKKPPGGAPLLWSGIE